MPGQEETHESHLQRKVTLVKSKVGCVKASCYDLPQGSDHVYGGTNKQAQEGVGDLLSSWVTSNPSSGKESSKLIVFSNILAIKNGCVTARAMRKYASEHPNIRRKEALETSSARVDTRFEGPFGRATHTEEDGFDKIIQGKYTNYGPEDVDYPDISCIKKTGSFPKPRPTNASVKLNEARLAKKNPPVQKKFCMKRFQNIKGTFHLPNQAVPAIPKPGHGHHQDEILVRHHHDLDAGHYHGEDHHMKYAHQVPSNLLGPDLRP